MLKVYADADKEGRNINIILRTQENLPQKCLRIFKTLKHKKSIKRVDMDE